MQFDKTQRVSNPRKLIIYKYLAIFLIAAAVLCMAVGMIISSTLLTFIGILLIVFGLVPLISPLVKGF